MLWRWKVWRCMWKRKERRRRKNAVTVFILNVHEICRKILSLLCLYHTRIDGAASTGSYSYRCLCIFPIFLKIATQNTYQRYAALLSSHFMPQLAKLMWSLRVFNDLPCGKKWTKVAWMNPVHSFVGYSDF